MVLLLQQLATAERLLRARFRPFNLWRYSIPPNQSPLCEGGAQGMYRELNLLNTRQEIGPTEDPTRP